MFQGRLQKEVDKEKKKKIVHYFWSIKLEKMRLRENLNSLTKETLIDYSDMNSYCQVTYSELVYSLLTCCAGFVDNTIQSATPYFQVANCIQDQLTLSCVFFWHYSSTFVSYHEYTKTLPVRGSEQKFAYSVLSLLSGGCHIVLNLSSMKLFNIMISLCTKLGFIERSWKNQGLLFKSSIPLSSLFNINSIA